jgi:hypothetical protein
VLGQVGFAIGSGQTKIQEREDVSGVGDAGVLGASEFVAADPDLCRSEIRICWLSR